MNEPVNLPPDDARDPLLNTLRERLGDYGAPPPPGAWAGIRKRLPAPVLPWWRRPGRLLPLLALLLGLVTAISVVHEWPTGASRLPELARTTPSAHGTQQASGTYASTGSAKQSVTGQTLSPASPTIAELTSTDAIERSQRATTKPSTTAQLTLNGRRPSDSGKTADLLVANTGKTAATTALRASINLTHKNLNYTPKQRYRSKEKLLASSSRAMRMMAAAKAPQLPSSTLLTRALATHTLPTSRPFASRVSTRLARRHYKPGASRRRLLQPSDILDSIPRATAPSAPARALAAVWANQYGQSKDRTVPATAQLHMPAEQSQLTLIELAKRPVSLVRAPDQPLPAPLAETPDSTRPALPVRRWALLATAGPTLSYRTIGATPSVLGRRPDFAHLERPALGFGAQVQVRRVLSGRWALAVGLGYQEYATRLALQQVDSGRATHISQRDTYRLLTLPVQLSYALGVPRGRLAKALLLGAEVGWYRGGRSTEGSDCHCQQQTYSATATDSLYAAHSLALSLGLDLRYRIGGPASRWQWLVQPTGRYVLTPFVKPSTSGFSQRQPFSLGLFTGFSWDIR
jgi:hypothetical protein